MNVPVASLILSEKLHTGQQPPVSTRREASGAVNSETHRFGLYTEKCISTAGSWPLTTLLRMVVHSTCSLHCRNGAQEENQKLLRKQKQRNKNAYLRVSRHLREEQHAGGDAADRDQEHDRGGQLAAARVPSPTAKQLVSATTTAEQKETHRLPDADAGDGGAMPSS